MDAPARSKIGQPAQSTTGLASTSSNHGQCTPKNISASSTADGGTLSQNRRSMSVYSGLTSSAESRVKLTGSSAMPQMGHEPGPICRIWACMGHVYSRIGSSAASRMQIFFRLSPELSGAFLGAKIVGLALIQRRPRRLLGIHDHAAHWIAHSGGFLLKDGKHWPLLTE